MFNRSECVIFKQDGDVHKRDYNSSADFRDVDSTRQSSRRLCVLSDAARNRSQRSEIPTSPQGDD